MNVRFALVLSAGAAVAALSLPAVATAGGHVTPGAECRSVGATGVARNGEHYRCVQKPGDDCPRWAWIYNPQVPKGSWSPRPKVPCDCPPSASASPSGGTSPSTTPGASTSPTPSPSTSVSTAGTPTATGVDTTPVGRELPVTGNTPYWTGGLGLVLLLAGLSAIALGRRRAN